MAYTPLTYDDYVTGYTNLAQISERNSLNEKMRSNTQKLNETVSGYNQSKRSVGDVYNSGMANLNANTTAQLPTFAQDANQISANTRIAAKRLAEVMASRGLLKSGGALMQQAGIYSQGNGALAENARKRQNFLTRQTNMANELAATQATGLADLDRQIALATSEAARNAQLYQETYNNNLAAAPLQAALNYPELYAAQTEQAAALLDTLLDYNAANNTIQGAVQVPTGFKYGDSMIALLKQLGLMA